MRKEAVNTFSGGLNYDLNPITTPNNVLTECINGSFITFNGDELALQNDAGNTKILIPNIDPDAPAEYVTLTEGFYPLGIKEYGGVLYIVSGKKGLNPDGSDDLIEFGSYPSPEILTEELTGNGLPFNFGSATKNSLYSSNVLNDTVFKAGEYAIFESTSLDVSNITIINYTDYVKSSDIKIYVAKLYLQLTNGFIDLTSDIWEEYAQFKGGTITNQFWFNDPDFKYYCKSNFKGKLIMSIELEDISFTLNYYNVDQIDEVGYEITFNISINNPTDWTITKLRINYSLDGIVQTSSDINLGTSQDDYIITLPFSNEGKILDFNITPIFYNPGTTTDVTNELPIIYLDKYTLSGSELLSNVFNYDTNDYEGNDYY